MTVCIYGTPELAQAALDDLQTRARVLWAEAGYTVDAEGVVAKVNGVDAPESQHTTQWDVVTQYVEGWGFISPRTKYPEYADALLAGHAYIEIPNATAIEVPL